jgi:hypothetical protein
MPPAVCGFPGYCHQGECRTEASLVPSYLTVLSSGRLVRDGSSHEAAPRQARSSQVLNARSPPSRAPHKLALRSVGRRVWELAQTRRAGRAGGRRPIPPPLPKYWGKGSGGDANDHGGNPSCHLEGASARKDARRSAPLIKRTGDEPKARDHRDDEPRVQQHRPHQCPQRCVASRQGHQGES